ncbi:unnamed protein product, partial [Rotaria sordida]
SLFIKPLSNEFYHSVKHLVDAYQEDAGVLPRTLVEYSIPLILNSNASSSSSSSSTISTSSSLSSLTIQK